MAPYKEAFMDLYKLTCNFPLHLRPLSEPSPVSDAWRHTWGAPAGMLVPVTLDFWPSLLGEQKPWMSTWSSTHLPSATTYALSFYERQQVIDWCFFPHGDALNIVYFELLWVYYYHMDRHFVVLLLYGIDACCCLVIAVWQHGVAAASRISDPHSFVPSPPLIY